jgi:hypothetical protein
MMPREGSPFYLFGFYCYTSARGTIAEQKYGIAIKSGIAITGYGLCPSDTDGRATFSNVEVTNQQYIRAFRAD